MGTHAAVGVEPMQLEATAMSMPFAEIYRLEYAGLVAVATALTGDLLDGEDAVHDTMVKALVSWDRVGRLQSPGGWCHRVLLNACTSRFRRRRTEQRWRSRLRHEVVTTPEPSADVVAFWTIVRSLPTRPRAIVTLHFAGERTMAEIAHILGVPEGTVRSDVARARSYIMRELGVRP